MNNSTLAIVIVDGVGYKNFFMTDAVVESQKVFKKVIIYSCLPTTVFPKESREHVIELPVYKESGTSWMWRKCREVAHLRKHAHNNFGINANLERTKSSGYCKRALITKAIFQLTRVFNSERFIAKCWDRQQQSFRTSNLYTFIEQQLKKDKPDLLFFTHQRPAYIAPVAAAATKLNIKTATFIFSWDNLISKGRMASPFTHYLVWSNLMKHDLTHFYKQIVNKQIHVIGTPQFEPYILDRYGISKDIFLERFNLKSQLKSICYSCGDVSTSKNDPIYIEIIAQAMQDNLIENAQLLVRTSPAEDGSRFDNLIQRYPFIIWNKPAWELSREDHPEKWSQRIPTDQDIKDLRAITSYCDVNINMCSTMSLDFMIFGKPVVNIALGSKYNELYNDQKYFNYAHYKTVLELGAVGVAREENELIKEINYSLKNPNARLKQQQELIKLQISKPLEGTSQRIAATLAQIVDNA